MMRQTNGAAESRQESQMWRQICLDRPLQESPIATDIEIYFPQVCEVRSNLRAAPTGAAPGEIAVATTRTNRPERE